MTQPYLFVLNSDLLPMTSVPEQTQSDRPVPEVDDPNALAGGLSLKAATGYTFVNKSHGLMNEVGFSAREDVLSVDVSGNYAYFNPPGPKPLEHQLRVSFLPKLHLNDVDDTSDPYLSFLGFGGAVLLAPDQEAIPMVTLSPLGLGLICHFDQHWSADMGVRVQAALPKQGDLRLGAEIPVGVSYRF